MCGFAGIVYDEARPIDRGLLGRMAETLRHRGPDDEGFYTDERAGLAFRRLSIIDIEGGHQPLSNEDGTIWIVFNGEIYNFKELRGRLERAGHRFRTESDTETIVHLYEEVGPAAVDHLRGMFAFAIWDRGKGGKLMLARDRAGKKPLYYAERDGAIAFASEIKALLEWPALPREVETDAIGHYLTYGYTPSPGSMFRHVQKLEPAHYLIRDRGRSSARRYWQLDYRDKLILPRREDYLDLIREKTKEATRLRMVADVPIGVFLSGGVDSGSVVSCMCAEHEDVQSFSIGFQESEFSELPIARQVATRYGTRHREHVVRPDALAILPKLVWHYDEPFADFSSIPTYYVASLTRQDVTVALTGDGGDESFAGYPRYRHGRATWGWSWPPPALWGMAARAAGFAERRVAGTGRERFAAARRFAEAMHGYPDPRRRHARWIALYHSDAEKEGVLSPELWEGRRDHDSVALLADRFDQVLADDPLDRILAVDVETYLAQDLLVKMDVATMATSLEARSPYLDHELMELAARIPASMKLESRRTKPLLRDAWRSALPADVVMGPKVGFRMPIERWFRSELRGPAEAFLAERPSPYWRREGIRALFREHAAGIENHTFRIWALLWFEVWRRTFIERDPPGSLV
ncbi:MAG: asparagine synthase (glutamine-hydrolyzing) [Gemmatimonadetes bacterium]|nr:asparagine synthase (glutamine-hydrolyzing) [Gemmatimonadota bacterium]